MFWLLKKGLDEIIYYKFIILKNITDKYPKISYHLLWKDGFSPILNMSLIVSYIYKKREKLIKIIYKI